VPVQVGFCLFFVPCPLKTSVDLLWVRHREVVLPPLLFEVLFSPFFLFFPSPTLVPSLGLRGSRSALNSDGRFIKPVSYDPRDVLTFSFFFPGSFPSSPLKQTLFYGFFFGNSPHILSPIFEWPQTPVQRRSIRNPPHLPYFEFSSPLPPKMSSFQGDLFPFSQSLKMNWSRSVVHESLFPYSPTFPAFFLCGCFLFLFLLHSPPIPRSILFFLGSAVFGGNFFSRLFFILALLLLSCSPPPRRPFSR